MSARRFQGETHTHTKGGTIAYWKNKHIIVCIYKLGFSSPVFTFKDLLVYLLFSANLPTLLSSLGWIHLILGACIPSLRSWCSKHLHSGSSGLLNIPVGAIVTPHRGNNVCLVHRYIPITTDLIWTKLNYFVVKSHALSTSFQSRHSVAPSTAQLSRNDFSRTESGAFSIHWLFFFIFVRYKGGLG